MEVKHHVQTEAEKTILRKTEALLLRKLVHRICGDLQILSQKIKELHLTPANTMEKEHWGLIDLIARMTAETLYERYKVRPSDEEQERNQTGTAKNYSNHPIAKAAINRESQSTTTRNELRHRAKEKYQRMR